MRVACGTKLTGSCHVGSTEKKKLNARAQYITEKVIQSQQTY